MSWELLLLKLELYQQTFLIDLRQLFTQYGLSINSKHSLVHDFTKGSLQLMSKHIRHEHAVKGFMFLDAHTQWWVVILEPLTSKLISMKSQRVFADTIFYTFWFRPEESMLGPYDGRTWKLYPIW